MASDKEGEKIGKNFRAPQALNHREIYSSKIISDTGRVRFLTSNGDNPCQNASLQEKGLYKVWTPIIRVSLTQEPLLYSIKPVTPDLK